MIKISFNSTDKRVVATLRAKGPQIIAGIESTLEGLMLELQATVVRKLSGQVLAHRSGKLAGSINMEPIRREGSWIVGRVTGAAGPAFYGKIQEKGGTREYEIKPVHKQALAFFPQNSLGAGGGIVKIDKSLLRGLRYKSGERRGELKEESYNKFGQYGGVVVSKVIHPPLPPRPFMRTSLEEMRGKIVQRIQAAVGKVVTT